MYLIFERTYEAQTQKKRFNTFRPKRKILVSENRGDEENLQFLNFQSSNSI